MARKKNIINNSFYDTLQDNWIYATDHPIALLRAENTLRNPWIEKVIQEKKPHPCKILDIGCGAGLLTNPLAKQGHIVSGIDLSPSSLEVARKLDMTNSVHYKTAKAEELPFAENSFDVVCAMDLLEHVNDPSLVIKEASRVLKPDGLFFFHTFNRNPISYFIIIKGVEWFVKNAPSNMHVYPLFITPKELGGMCKLSQLQVEMMQGMRPDFAHKAFWKMLLTRKVDPGFKFTFTPSLLTGYVGFAKKI
ncbi:MAG: bifunctional 2-polyprenyl-6-hydroxyphenol methylase/3-demethylubiquinol 3-O-methyltransferase UbiG [Chlamydiota bacterium]